MNSYITQNNRGIRLAFGYQSRVGKDTCADYVIDKYGGIKLAYAAELYKLCGIIQSFFGAAVVKDTWLLQRMGTLGREHYGADVWVDKLLSRVDAAEPMSHIIVSDIRYPNELDALRARGFVAVNITRPGREIDRDQTHSSENSLGRADFDYHIANNSTMDELFGRIDRIVNRVWPAPDL